ncbi:MAG: fumarylacetoacetate hydrolase family protein [Rhodospirillaceae bacterium]|jgi:2-keto-4-pentenoate hydratase/2-oxohepta-3-ene-1,7-dioic acid hydratase in catechol pathway|nr:fumarylacetoacetate hydrolase family protein [Rhodospirillaceae bacterium]MBT5939924.1 fumarylacetoacetate hydrolase family protein [Rhodospirillaceae bacterium]
MTQWVRFNHGDAVQFGTLDGETINIHGGFMFEGASSTGETVALVEVELLTPCVPSKIVALWNNSQSAAEKQGLKTPEDPLFFIKGANTFLASGGIIQKPNSYDGRVIYEAELGIVIGKTCKEVSEADTQSYIFGFTCVNDVTALQLLDKDPSFPQWARAKGFDTFGAFGPAIVADVDISGSSIRAELNGRERQNYPVSDLMMQPAELVHRISQDMTLFAGDIISCGTGPGALPMKPGAQIDVIIDGVGTLTNTYE